MSTFSNLEEKVVVAAAAAAVELVMVVRCEASEKRAFSELQLTGLWLARRKQEGGSALRAFIFIYIFITSTTYVVLLEA